MTIEQIHVQIRELQPQLDELGIKSLSVFGSTACGQARSGSDIDFLVEFEGPATFTRYMDLKEMLEAKLQARIDLVTVRALKPTLREKILNEAVKVA